MAITISFSGIDDIDAKTLINIYNLLIDDEGSKPQADRILSSIWFLIDQMDMWYEEYNFLEPGNKQRFRQFCDARKAIIEGDDANDQE